MEVQELKQLIKKKEVPNFLIFTGEEYEVQKIYIQQIAKVKNLSIHYAYDIDEIWSKLNTATLFGEDMLYVLRDDREFTSNEKIYSQIEAKLKNNTLIYIATSYDKRLKLYKQYKYSILEFNALKSDVLKRYIQKEIALNDRNCEILMDICEYNYGHCLLEIDKIQKSVDYAIANEDNTQADLVNYALKGSGMTVTGISVNKVFERLLEDGTIYVPPRDTIWDFIKAWLQNKPKRAYDLYQDLKELQTPIFSILSNLYNNTRQVLQVQTCTGNNIEKTTGLTAWQIRNAKECVGKYRARDLAVLMRLIQKVETDIKTGQLDESIAIDYIFTSFF